MARRMGSLGEAYKSPQSGATEKAAVLVTFRAGASVKSLAEMFHLPVAEIERIIREALRSR